MTTTTDHTTVFTRPTGDDAFELPPTRGVGTTTAAPRRRHDVDVDVDVVTIPARRHVARETHPYSDTLNVLNGEITRTTNDTDPTTVAHGTSWHVATDHRHEATNHGPCDAVVVTLVGV